MSSVRVCVTHLVAAAASWLHQVQRPQHAARILQLCWHRCCTSCIVASLWCICVVCEVAQLSVSTGHSDRVKLSTSANKQQQVKVVARAAPEVHQLPTQLPAVGSKLKHLAAPVCAEAVGVEQQWDVEVLPGHAWCDGELNHSLRVEGHSPEHIRVRLPTQRQTQAQDTAGRGCQSTSGQRLVECVYVAGGVWLLHAHAHAHAATNKLLQTHSAKHRSPLCCERLPSQNKVEGTHTPLTPATLRPHLQARRYASVLNLIWYAPGATQPAGGRRLPMRPSASVSPAARQSHTR